MVSAPVKKVEEHLLAPAVSGLCRCVFLVRRLDDIIYRGYGGTEIVVVMVMFRRCCRSRRCDAAVCLYWNWGGSSPGTQQTQNARDVKKSRDACHSHLNRSLRVDNNGVHTYQKLICIVRGMKYSFLDDSAPPIVYSVGLRINLRSRRK